MIPRTLFLPLQTAALILFLRFGSGTSFTTRILFILSQAAIIALVLYYIPTTSLADSYFFGTSSFFTALNTSTLFLLSDPYSLHLVEQKPFSLLTPRKKTEWAVSLQLSSRGIGWNWEVPYLRPPLATTRGGFVVTAGKRLALMVLLREVAVWLLHYADGTEGWKGRLPLAVGQMCWSIIILEISWLVAMIVFVGTGVVWGDPKMAKPLMGGVWDVYTVRKFWGRGWHQMLRRNLQSHGRYLCGVFGAKKGGALSNYTQIFTAFTLCGIGHWFGNYAADPTGLWVWTMVFFVGQGGAIMVEDFVIAMGRRCGVKDGGLVRMLGRVWVVGWFVFAWPWFGDELMDCGAVPIRARGVWEILTSRGEDL